MNYLRSVVSDVKLKYRASRVVYDCVAKREQPEFTQYLTECVDIADGHPELVLTTLHEYLTFRLPENAYGGLLLLEQLVSLCNYGFHLALAKDYDIQDRIIQLAVKRGEGEAHRKAQRLARLTLLEYSRVFVDDRELLRLSSLASSFEYRTRKSLMRCLNVQNRRVRFRDIDKSDIIPISPKESLGSTSANAARAVTPLQLSSAPEVWPCHVCTYLNAPSATRCAACETLRSMDSIAHRATPTGTPKTTPKMAPQPSPPTPPPPPPATPSPPPNASFDDSANVTAGAEGVAHTDNGSEGTCSLADSPRHTDADLALPPDAAAHSTPPVAAVFHDPALMNKGATAATSTPAPFEYGLRSHDATNNGAVERVSGGGQHGAAGDADAVTSVFSMATPPPAATADAAAATAETPPPADAPLDFFVVSPSPQSL